MKCFRCGTRTNQALFIHLEKPRSPVNPETHPICPECAVDFWRWADEVKTILTHQRVLAKREALKERETTLKQKEAKVEKMKRNLEKMLNLRELEVLGEVR